MYIYTYIHIYIYTRIFGRAAPAVDSLAFRIERIMEHHKCKSGEADDSRIKVAHTKPDEISFSRHVRMQHVMRVILKVGDPGGKR